MKLYYYRAEPGNFGDDLNLWLWPRLLGRSFPGLCYHDPRYAAENEDEAALFLGIGTLLNRTVPIQPMKLVFGTGAGYGDSPIVDDRWVFRAVRGPLTARALGLPEEMGMGDPGSLLRDLQLPASAPRESVAFMPHVQTAAIADWRLVCQDLGIRYIDPTAGVEEVLSLIQGSERVITEAMHGAIVCDALRIPWTPVACYDRINTFKWRDWCATLGLVYRPVRLPSLWPTPSFLRVRARVERLVKLRRARRALRTLKNSPTTLLSTDAALDAVTRRLGHALNDLIEHDLPRMPTSGPQRASLPGGPHG